MHLDKFTQKIEFFERSDNFQDVHQKFYGYWDIFSLKEGSRILNRD